MKGARDDTLIHLHLISSQTLAITKKLSSYVRDFLLKFKILSVKSRMRSRCVIISSITYTFSPDEICGMVSIHPLVCPINPSLVSDIKTPRQSMYKKGAFTVNASEYADDGFFIQFSTHPKYANCEETKPSNFTGKIKTFSCKITKHPSFSEILWLDILFTILFLFGVIVFFVLTFQYANILIPHLFQKNSVKKTDWEIYDNLQSVNWQKIENKRHMFIQSDLYFWMVIIITICYTIPAMQLVFKHQKQMKNTGDNDICYYNFLCAIPWYYMDFNHLFSNIGYILFGLAFILIVKFQWKKQNEKSKEEKGIPKYSGIYYAMGLSLMAEGCLSGFYHVCPNEQNFQFDTTFMYVISALMIIKIYQFRHPDVSSNAYKIFFFLSLVLLLQVAADKIISQQVLWVILTIVYLYVVMQLSSILYNSGKWNTPYQVFKNLQNFWSGGFKLIDSINKTKLIFVVFFNIINLGFIIFGNISQPNLPLSDFFLFVFMGNLMLYFVYYFIMKLYRKEKITIAAYIFLFFVIVSGPPAMYLFKSKTKTTRVSPAKSRNLNQDCITNMYDAHDLWHLISAEAIFSFYMLLLVIDDGIADTPRTNIHIF